VRSSPPTLDEAKEPLKFSGRGSRRHLLEKITKWMTAALKKLNPKVDLPDKEIHRVHRSDGSGTTLSGSIVSKVSKEWTRGRRRTSVKWPHRIGRRATKASPARFKRSQGSIGYVELIYAVQNDIKFGLVQNKEGNFIKASMESVTAAADASLQDIPTTCAIPSPTRPAKTPIRQRHLLGHRLHQHPRGKGQRGARILPLGCTHEGQKFCRKTALLAVAEIPRRAPWSSGLSNQVMPDVV